MSRHVYRDGRRGSLPGFLVAAALALCALAAPAGAKPGKGNGPPDRSQDYQPELRIQWSVGLQAAFSQVRPVVAADGRVYAVDALDNLYIVTPNGTPTPDVQVVPDAGRKGVDLDPSGNVYTGNEDWIKAFDPDGNLLWTFVTNPRAFILSDVAVGPQGNIYAVASNGIGVFSLTPGGTERWRTAELYDRSNALYSEIAFGPGRTGDQLYFRVNQNTRGLLTDTGAEVFSLTLGADRPVVSPFDFSWHRSDAAYDSDGNLLWQFAGFPAATGAVVPALGADGTHYTVNQGFRVFAIDPFGSERWQTELDENVGLPDVDPANSQLIMPTSVTPTHPAALRAVHTANGGDLWRLEFPLPVAPATGEPFVDSPLAFSPEGTIAYVITGVAGGQATLHAVALDPGIPNASTLLRAQQVDIQARVRRNEFRLSGEVTVTDENRAVIAGAVVTATWTASNGLSVTQEGRTNGKGVADFSISGPGGTYTLSVDAIVKDPYTFDPDHSQLSGSQVVF